jgi:hypothetical protein
MPARLSLYLIAIDLGEEPSELLDFLNRNHGVEIGSCVWVVPWQKHFALLLGQIERLLPPRTGICLVPLLPDAEMIQSRGNSVVARKLKTLGLRSQPE